MTYHRGDGVHRAELETAKAADGRCTCTLYSDLFCPYYDYGKYMSKMHTWMQLVGPDVLLDVSMRENLPGEETHAEVASLNKFSF